MLIPSRMGSKSFEKKKLSLNISNSSHSKSNFKISNPIKQKHQSLFFKPFGSKNLQQNNSKDKCQEKQLPLILNENAYIKREISLHKSQGKFQKSCNSKVSLRFSKNQTNSFTNFPLIDVKSSKVERLRLRIGDRIDGQDDKLEIAELLMTNAKEKCGNQEDTSTLNQFSEVQEQKLTIKYRKKTNKKSSSVHVQTIDTQSIYDRSEGSDSQLFRKIHLAKSTLITQRKKSKELKLESTSIQICISPHSKPNMHSVEVQAIHQQRQYYDYLRFKRRKTQFESELQNLFKDINLVKNDRFNFQARIQKLKSAELQKPQNQRQQRIFKIKDEIQLQEKKIKKIISQKNKKFQNYVSQLSKLSKSLFDDSQKFLLYLNSRFNSSKDNLKLQNQNLNYDKIQKHISSFFRQSIKKIQTLVQRIMPSQQFISQFYMVFEEYKKAMTEQKSLLRNCFMHIKKIPELCYGLCGNELPNPQSRKQFRNEDNKFSMPKCIQCTNSEWKMHLIIEKNILMESIFKVTEQLLK